MGVGVEEAGDYSTFESKLGNKPRGSQVDMVVVAEPEGVQEVEAVASLEEEEVGHSSQLVDTYQGMVLSE